MKINIYMLFDEFPPDAVRLAAEEKAHSLDISGILFLSSKDSTPDSNHLYVCTPKEANDFLNYNCSLHFAIVGRFDDEDALRELGHSAIIFTEETDIFTVFNHLQVAKEKLDAWDAEMLAAIIAKRPVKAVLDIGAKLLWNPIALFDKDFGLITTAGNLPESISGSIWESVLEKSYSPPSALSPKQRRDVMKKLLDSDWPIVYRSNVLSENHLCCGLLVSGVFFGTFGLSEFKPFTQGQISILACLAKRMEQALADSFDESGTTADMPYYINRLLSGYDINENAIDYHLQQRGWRESDYFRVLRLETSEKAALSEGECAAYQNPIKSVLPDSLIFQYENGIVVILHSALPRLIPPTLTALIENFSLRAGVSMEFNSFIYTKYAYIQSKEALENGDGSISFFERCYAKCLVSTIGQITSPKSMCHPGILRAWQRGGAREQQFISSIHVYLQNGRNLTDTAKKLGIHRNTLTYRIERVNEIVGLDLFSDTIDDNTLLLLNISCQIVMNLSL